MKCKHSRKYHKGYVKCQKDGSVRKESCKEECHLFEPTFWDKLMYRLTYGRKWEG